MYGQQPPPGFNFYMPMGRTVPVVFTGHGIQIPGFNAPVSASSTPATCWMPDAVTEEESSSSTLRNAEQMEEKIAVAGVFKILPEGPVPYMA
ncbi:hypothetical protein IscW_ISCW014214 [Ixodes scapularis]|uniref:Uncharacterized protein n=1 Tax=Ixodes scapularis TaxID=6945 RepID=B7QI54_IXOSC|nr:hypothetical protein IscW_ISCW014214 [Ixodes scapularis]|eukprot:XP_002414861.1 hypothetical protein IscW_ISCW014214 [Ixodes scapularis]